VHDADENRGSIARAGFLGGLLMSVLVATPFLRQINTCCCALVVVGGLFAAWMLQTDSKGQAGVGRCAWAGLLAGLFGGLVGSFAAAAVNRLAFGAAGVEQQVAAALEGMRQLMQGNASPPGFDEMAEAMVRASLGADFGAWSVLIALAQSVVFAFFGLLGGLLGGLWLRKPIVIGVPGNGVASRPDVGTRPAATSVPSQPAWSEEPASTEGGPLSPEELPLLSPAPDAPSTPPDREPPTDRPDDGA
jgi:hypothetical protein